MRVHITLPLLGLAISIPVVQQILTLPKWIASKIPIALLMYVPGLLVVFWDMNERVGDLRRLECVYLLTGPSVFGYLQLVCMVMAVYTVIFEVLRRLRVSNWTESVEPRFTPGLYPPLAGAGPNNGRIDDWGTAGVHTAPLLPLSIKNGNIEMAKLLIEFGADLNPKLSRPGPNAGANPEWNNLYYATINDDKPMLEFLVEHGADPTRNITTAVRMKNMRQLAFLLNNGGDVEAVRHELKEQDLEKTLANMLEKISAGAGM